MLGPSGIGCLVGKAERLLAVTPRQLGGGVVDHTTLDGYQLRKIPHRFEAGTPAIESACGFAAALDYLEALGWEAIAAHDQRMNETFLTELAKRPRLQLLGPRTPEERTSIFSVYVEGLDDLSDVSRALSDSHGVMCRNGHLCAQPLVDSFTDGEVLRLSAYLYNTPEEIRYALAKLEEVVEAYRE
jgi:cysteine desulfurase / selenocysteine lyase